MGNSPIAINPDQVNLQVYTTAIDILVNPGVDRVEIALPIDLVGRYDPIVSYGHVRIPIPAWVLRT